MHYIISLMHTSHRDKYLTLWRKDNAGYCYSKENAGLYLDYERGYHDSAGNMPITETFANLLFTKVMYEGQPKNMILNNKHNHLKLGLKRIKGELTKAIGIEAVSSDQREEIQA